MGALPHAASFSMFWTGMHDIVHKIYLLDFI